MASELGVQTIQHTNGTDAMTIDSSGNATFPNRYPKVAFIADKKASNVDGGTSVSGWNDRDLNTEIFDPDGIVSISSNQFTLGAGTYIIEFSAPAYRADRHIAQLYDVTNTAAVQTGKAAYASNSNAVMNNSEGCAYISITSSNTYKVRHNLSTVQSTNGLGVKANTTDSIYTTVKITKIAG